MATDLGRVKPAASSKYDAFVAAQLARAESRIRLLDLTAALLGFAALGLAYIVGMVLCDSKLELSQHARQLSLYAFLIAAAVYLFFMVVRPLRLRVNPYYAARQVEQLLPGAKNSIVNWVDLHAQPLPPAIRGALGQRAAKDLSRVDLENAIRGRRALDGRLRRPGPCCLHRLVLPARPLAVLFAAAQSLQPIRSGRRLDAHAAYHPQTRGRQHHRDGGSRRSFRR